MELIWSTNDFIVTGRSYVRFPILLWDSMESCTPVNDFFRWYLLRGSIGSTKSWESTARALLDFFNYLQSNNLSWNSCKDPENKNVVAAYRDSCLTDRKLNPKTVRQRLIYIAKFYEFSHENGLISRSPFAYEERCYKKVYGPLSHLSYPSVNRSICDIFPRVFKTLPKYLTLEEIKRLLLKTSNLHDHIIIRFALLTGLRRNEIATFPIEYIHQAIAKDESSLNVRITLNPHDGTGMQTKGRKGRDIFISRKFLNELYRYIIQMRGERSTLADDTFNNLFLNQLGKPFANDGKRIERMVREVGNRAGMRVHTHLLRHTYATHMLMNLQRYQSDIDPLIFIQRQLGHSSINSTLIYLHVVHEITDEAVVKFQEELDDGWNLL